MSFFVCYCSLIFIIYYNYTYLAIGLVPLDHQHISVYLLSLFICHVHHFCAVKPNNNNNNNNTCLAIFLCRRCVGVESEPQSCLCIECRSDCSHFCVLSYFPPSISQRSCAFPIFFRALIINAYTIPPPPVGMRTRGKIRLACETTLMWQRIIMDRDLLHAQTASSKRGRCSDGIVYYKILRLFENQCMYIVTTL